MSHHEKYAQRNKLLTRARKLARSGQYENHSSIIAELLQANDNLSEAARRYLTDRVIVAQLDKLCVTAKASAVVSLPPLRSVLADMRAGHPKPREAGASASSGAVVWELG